MKRTIGVSVFLFAWGAACGCSSAPTEGAPDGDDAGDGSPPGEAEPDAEGGGARDDGLLPDAQGPADASGCDRSVPILRVGCVETTAPPTLSLDGVATPVAGYHCRAQPADSLVRIRVCMTPPWNPCLTDSDETDCAVVDISASTLSSLPTGSTLILDGATTFTFVSPFDHQVRPENVVYTAGQANQVTRVWMEKNCFCSPIPPLTGSQMVSGALRIDSASEQRVTGRMTLSAAGHIAPINYSQHQVDVDAFFDVAIVKEIYGGRRLD